MTVADRFADQIGGAVLGAAIGDAMGHPTEFMSMDQLHARYGPDGVTGFELWWERGGRRFAPYTDDTQMAEVVLRALIAHRRPGFDAQRDLSELMVAIAAGFVDWASNPQGGHRAPGNACMAGCRALAQGVPWQEAGGSSAGGCGSVMRAYLFGVVFADDERTAEWLAVEHSKLTHRDPIALAACAAMAVGMVKVMNNVPVNRIAPAMIEAAERYSTPTAEMMERAATEAREGVAPDVTLDRLRGWAAHEAIAAGLYVFLRHADHPRAAILEGANTPGDSDSIATLAGALVGARCGASALPPDWVRDLERSDELLALAAAVCTDVTIVRPEAPRFPGILRRTYRLESWRTWDDELHTFVADFRGQLGIAPNILLASEVTHTRIDMAAKKQNVLDEQGAHPEPAEYAALSGFAGPDYELDFYVDPTLPDRSVSLVYDPDPDGGGEPVPAQDTREPVSAVGARRA
jgi:ADP-ribosylglycohydrolase